jgi:hypothetical protein
MAALALMFSSIGTAAVLTVEPDAYGEGDNISNAFPGVTLSSVGPGFDGDYDASIFAINPSVQPLEPFNASTGSLVFGTNDNTYPHLFGGWGDASFRADFAYPAKEVWLDAIGNDSSDYAMLQAFDAGDNPLGDPYYTKMLTSSMFETMYVSWGSYEIAYILASGVSGDSVGFDHLVAAVPEPATICLLGLGTLSLIRRKRRV